MAELRMRPRFALEMACDVRTLVAHLRDRLELAEPTLEGSFLLERCVLRIPPERQALWSPELVLTFETPRKREDGVRVRGLFGPRPVVFTAIVFVYAALAGIGFGGLVLGITQLVLQQTPSALTLTAGAALVAAGVYASSYVGRSFAAEQMYQLRRYLDLCVTAAEAEARAMPRFPLDSAQL